MTHEEIKKITYYLCEKRHKEEENSDSTAFLFPIDIYADIVSKLSERYCIVEKSKVKEEYNYYKNSWNETELTETIMESLEDIFGKELFNDKKK